jgi:putative ABC transport system ATP-binding protein
LARQGNTIIVVTHEEEIARHARRILRIRDGLIASDERVEGRASPVEGQVAPPSLDPRPSTLDHPAS